jgi:hypothetical protein
VLHRIQGLLALGLTALGLALLVDALSWSHILEWPLGVFVVVVGVIWLVGRIGWWLVLKD